MRKSIVESLIVFTLIASVKCKNYEGYKVYEVILENSTQQFIFNTLDSRINLDIWKEAPRLGDSSNVMVEPQDQRHFEEQLSSIGVKYKIVIDDVEKLIRNETNERRLLRSSVNGGVTFYNYMTYDEQMAYLRNLAQNYPHLTTLENIGQSYEGRDILLLRISNGTSRIGQPPKPVIFIDAGIHSREWIAPPVALYIIQQLVQNTDNAPLLANVDWAIVPNLNPDGYDYSQKVDRLWRKNRRLTEGQLCYGTDLNRNYGYFWMHDGASSNSCDETYAGPEAFSEPETRAIRDWFLRNGQDVKLYLTFHSYGALLLYPWGYAFELPDDNEELLSLGNQVSKAISNVTTLGSSYYVSASAIGLYPAAGGSDDWVKGVANVSLAYTVELPKGDAPHSFMLPARQILPVVQETFEGVKAFHKYIEEIISTQ